MGYPVEYARRLNFPRIPEHLLPDPEKWKFFEFLEENEYKTDHFWTDDQNDRLNEWCQRNVCENAYFAFVISNGLEMHKDGSEHEGLIQTTRLLYPITTGGEHAVTQFWADDKKTLLKEYTFEPFNWYLLAGSTYHSVRGVPKDKYRLIVSAQMLHQKI